MRGIVKAFDERRGYGFVTAEDGVDVFLHVKSFRRWNGRYPKQGDRLLFQTGQDAQGRPRASYTEFVDG